MSDEMQQAMTKPVLLWKTKELKAKLAQVEKNEGELARLKAELAACVDLLDKQGKTFDRAMSQNHDLKKELRSTGDELNALARRVYKACVKDFWA